MTDINVLCRTCMKTNESLVNIFVPFKIEEANNIAIELADILMNCASIQIIQDDGLPQNICEQCLKMLRASYAFKNQAQQADRELRRMLIQNIVKDEDIEVKNESYDDMYNNYDSLSEELKDDIVTYECNICCKKFTKHKKFLKHLKTHEESEQYKLSDSEKIENVNEEGFSKEMLLDTVPNLENIKTEEEVFQCSQCELSFTKRRSLSMHMKKHKPKKSSISKDITISYKCDICIKEFTRKSLLRRHMKLHDMAHPYSCTKCSKSYTREDQLMEHMNTHDGIRNKVCPYCKKSFTQLGSLKDHIRTHTGETPYLCSECGKGFNNSSNLRQHMMRHTGIKPYSCNLCPKTFCTKGQMTSHLGTHTDAHPYKCDVCDRAFTKPNSLKKHKMIHLGIKPFACETCTRSFTSKDHLKRHNRIHTGEKPYRCKYCERSFSQSNDLVKHTRSHVGEKIYSCTVCDMKFRLVSELKKHYPVHYIDGTDPPNVSIGKNRVAPVLLLQSNENDKNSSDVTQLEEMKPPDGRITITFNDKNGVGDITIDLLPQKS